MRGEHQNHFYPDFVVCLDHFPGDEPLPRLIETMHDTKDVARWVNADGSVGDAVELDDLTAMQQWLRSTRPRGDWGGRHDLRAAPQSGCARRLRSSSRSDFHAITARNPRSQHQQMAPQPTSASGRRTRARSTRPPAPAAARSRTRAPVPYAAAAAWAASAAWRRRAAGGYRPRRAFIAQRCAGTASVPCCRTHRRLEH